MAHEFEVSEQIELEATPEQVWEAIATGPGVDSWLMGRNTIQPGLGGHTRMDMGGWGIESTITAWDPPKHFAFKGDPGPDGGFHAFEYLVEAREGGSTTLRFVHSGFIGGDDWETEYDALRKGDPVYLHKLAQYLKYFPGRVAAPIGAYGGQVADKDRAWQLIRAGLGLSGPVAVGEQVHLTPAGLPPIDGVVDFLSEDFLGVRSDDALYRFIHGFQGSVVVGHHIFGAPGQPAPEIKETEQAWQAWTAGLVA